MAGCSTAKRSAYTIRGADGPGTGPYHSGGERQKSTSAVGTAAPNLDVDHPRVQDLVEKYQTSMRPTMERALVRGSKYVPGMKSALRAEGVPPDFAYGVPIVESGYSLHATSHAGAVGPWQFIRGTGQRYGLRIDGYVDERRDPEKATRAAARYLRDLYDRFGDWHLALAAYNTGEANIERIKFKRGCDTFWEMRERGYLPSETSEYVPRVLAAMQVAKAAKQYGIEVPKSPEPQFDTIEVTRPITLKAVAQLSGSDVDTINELNPALKRGVVPPDGYMVRLPQGTRNQFQVALASYREPPPPPVRRSSVYTVRRGDTLSAIASRHDVSVQSLMRANGLRRNRTLRAGQRLRVPTRPVRTRVVASASHQSRDASASASRSRGGGPIAKQAAMRNRSASSTSSASVARSKPRASNNGAARSRASSGGASRSPGRVTAQQ
jgi:membrane-bound lytic murein transglycosylase D